MSSATIPTTIDDPVNTAILAIAEDQLSGFQREPFAAIARLSGVPEPTVIERIRAMLEAGTIRRVRQTLMTTNLTDGALIAWKVPPALLDSAFASMSNEDPFSGHVVIRSTEPTAPGASFRLWTTLKVPQGYSLQKHAALLAARVGAEAYQLMPAKRVFALGVGHVRRRSIAPGARADTAREARDTEIVPLCDLDWRVLTAMKREFTPEELRPEPWISRAEEAGMSLEEFSAVAESLDHRGVLGRFSTFLEHVKPASSGHSVTRFNALFHWAVPAGRELDAGREVGRHHIMTHAYWREGGEPFGGVNIMGVAHGTDQALLLEHKAAIDAHLAEAGIPVRYTNVFWGGRSEIKPSELSPIVYADWCRTNGIDPTEMRDA